MNRYLLYTLLFAISFGSGYGLGRVHKSGLTHVHFVRVGEGGLKETVAYTKEETPITYWYIKGGDVKGPHVINEDKEVTEHIEKCDGLFSVVEVQ